MTPKILQKFDRFNKLWYNKKGESKGGFKLKNMKNNIKSSIIRKTIFISLIFVIILGISVLAGNVKLNSVNIKFSNNKEITVLTAKTKVLDILNENHIVLEENETVSPAINEEITNTNTIKISLKGKEEVKIAENIVTEIDKEQLLSEYTNLTEKIEVVVEDIPFDTVTKDVSNGSSTTRNAIIQAGRVGKKEVTYKVTYKDDIELLREELSSKVIKEPVDKIVQVQAKTTITSRNSLSRMAVSGDVAEYQAYAQEKCYEYGWSDSDFECLVALWNRESGWRVTAENRSSGAYGIPQSLPASKMASYGSDYLTNYQTQINWGLNYIKARYGTPTAAWNHSQNTGWY